MGNPNRNTRGYGQVSPNEINNNGDPTGIVTGVTWSTWGGKTAEGRGTSYYTPPNGAVVDSYRAPVKVRAYGLTTCSGQAAYRYVTWWFPSKGQTFASSEGDSNSRYNLCNE